MYITLKELFDIITDNIKIYGSLEQSNNIINLYCGTDWKQYIINTKSYYYKNLIFRSDLIELYIITWPISISSCIHDHPDKGCILKVLYGKLEETSYDKINDTCAKIKEVNILNEQSIGFKISDNVLHKIKNINDDISVSLHIYASPNYICNKYVEL